MDEGSWQGRGLSRGYSPAGPWTKAGCRGDPKITRRLGEGRLDEEGHNQTAGRPRHRREVNPKLFLDGGAESAGTAERGAWAVEPPQRRGVSSFPTLSHPHLVIALTAT